MGPEGSPWNSTVRASVGRLGTSIADGRRGLRSGRVRTAHFPREVGEDGFVGVVEPARSDGRFPLLLTFGGGPVVEASSVGSIRGSGVEPVSVVVRDAHPRGGLVAFTARAVLAAAFAVVQRWAIQCRPLGRSSTGRYPIRPVLKHGPRSLACARVAGWQTPGRSESDGRSRRPVEVGSRSPFGGGGRTTGPSRARRRPREGRGRRAEAERERTRRDPKDGELCLSRTKPEETLVEVRSDSDVQIDRQTWV